MVQEDANEIIIQNMLDWDIPRPEKKYKVVIHCSTYKHEKYIEKALKGFVMQKANFPFCAIIIDDFSPDSTASIIKSYAVDYPDIIIPICLGYNHMQNGLSRRPYFEMWHEAAEYISQCEGDDYWIDPYKLQKQVSFLESHLDYSMCFHSAWNQYDQNPNLTDLFSSVENRDYSSSEILSNWIIPTASVVFRKEIIESSFYKDKVLPMHFMFGDTPLFLTCAKFGKVRGFADTMSVYRRHEGGISRGFSIESYKRLADYSLNLGKVFEMESIGRTMSCRALFDGFCFAIKNRRLQFSLLYRAFRLSPLDVLSFIVERVSNAMKK